MCERIGTKPKLSTAFHPETDGQTENANAGLKQYLRAYVNYNQNDWVDFLAIAEFEANSDTSASTGLSPFLATKGYHPRSGTEAPTSLVPTTPQGRNEMRAADALAKKVNALRQHLREELKWSQALQAKFANNHRRPSPDFRVGDFVMLDARNIKTTRPSNSLDHKNLGPFEVLEAIDGNTAYRLKLPDSMKSVHPVFHP